MRFLLLFIKNISLAAGGKAKKLRLKQLPACGLVRCINNMAFAIICVFFKICFTDSKKVAIMYTAWLLRGVTFSVRKKLSIKFKIFVVCSLLVVIPAVSAALLLASEDVYRGVHCAGVPLEGMTYDKMVNTFIEELGEESSADEISLVLDGRLFALSTEDIDVVYDYEKTAMKALEYGRSGSFLSRAKKVFGAFFFGYDMPMEVTYNKSKLDLYVAGILEGIGTPVIEYSYEVKDGKLYLTNGTPGDMPGKTEVCSAILQTIGMRNFDKKLEFEKKERLPGDIDVEALYDEIRGEPADAYFERQGNEVVVIPHKYGIDFDKNIVAGIITENKGFGKTYEIPAKITAPDVLANELREKLFSQTLGSYKTTFNTGQVARSQNIYLASSKINNLILMPGEEFSYNNVVGERTKEAGFEIASVYMNNEVVDGIGGGICQVSSTLYCAVLYADLEVVERKNHQLTVSYVPLGQDATIDYGNIDFRFRNNTDYPIKIISRAGGAQIEVSIVGYREKPVKVTIKNITVSTIPPGIVEEEDPTLPLGEKKVKTQGSYGSIVETYKEVTVDGVKGNPKLISKSTYSPGKTIMLIGTKPLEDEEENAESEEGIEADAGLGRPTANPPAGEVVLPVEETE